MDSSLSTESPSPSEPRDPAAERRHRLRHALEHAAHYLPAQAPLEVFIHHNTLHAFQSMPFHEGLRAARQRLGVRTYLSEERYREALRRGRITDDDLRACLRAARLPASSLPWPQLLPSQEALALLVLQHGLHETTAQGLRWLISETDVTRKLRSDLPAAASASLLGESREYESPDDEAREERDEAARVSELYQACATVTAKLTLPKRREASGPRFHRELLVERLYEDPDELVHPTLIPLCAAFLDRGQAQWSMPNRVLGFFRVWEEIMTAGMVVRPAWTSNLGRRIKAHVKDGIDAEAEVLVILDELGIADDELEEFISRILLELPGWAGMFARLEQASDPVLREHVTVTLLDFLAVRLSLDELAYLDVARRHGFSGPLRKLREFLLTLPEPQLAPAETTSPHRTAWPLFQVAQLLGLRAVQVRELGIEGARAVCEFLSTFSAELRLPIWQEAFERGYRERFLSAISENSTDPRPAESVRPRYQIILCMDDREESFRRYLEALSKELETFGTAGFFNLAIAYQGIDDPTTFPLCPVVVTPQHQIVEEPLGPDAKRYARRQRVQRGWGFVLDRFSWASRSLLLGWLVTAVTGFVAALPLLLTVFAPSLAARVRRRVSQGLLPQVKTQLATARESEAADPVRGRMKTGFSVEEKAARVAGLLENIGLTKNFSDLVILLGHDSRTVNNPHFAAYACGACGGRSGGPNARLFARMANRPKVRELLKQRGIEIPDSTRFVGGVHDTCSDTVTLFDEEEIPEARRPDVLEVTKILNRALLDNARERARRFDSAPRNIGASAAIDHVGERAADLSQARPELCHATIAGCIVGRRALSKGVFLDRRVFLVSYDPKIDTTGEILERTLAAVGPVGSGINLEYFFSSVDTEGLGAGTKLPYNVTALVGVMNGASSDLRTGLPTQMTEIHEPVRLHCLIESRPEVLAKIMERQPVVAELVKNEWMRVALIDPDTSEIKVYEAERGFVPWHPPDTKLPVTHSWQAWYHGQMGYVGPARIAHKPGVAEGG